MEVDEKRRLQVFDRAGLAFRCLSLDSQGYLDVLLSNDRHRKALLLKVPKEYDLVRSRRWFAPSDSKSKSSCRLIQVTRTKITLLYLESVSF